MSKNQTFLDSGWYVICRDIIRHPSVLSAPPAYRCVLITIIDRAAYQIEKKDDHGNEVILQVGQLLCTYRQLAEWANVSKNDVERAVSRFLRVGILRQEVRHTKSIITLLFPITYKQIKSICETESGTKVRQERDRKKQKQTSSNEEETTTTEQDDVVVSFEEFSNTEDEYNPQELQHNLYIRTPDNTIYNNLIKFSLISEDDKSSLIQYSEERVNKAIEFVSHPDFECKKSIVSTMHWHCRQKIPPVHPEKFDKEKLKNDKIKQNILIAKELKNNWVCQDEECYFYIHDFHVSLGKRRGKHIAIGFLEPDFKLQVLYQLKELGYVEGKAIEA